MLPIAAPIEDASAGFGARTSCPMPLGIELQVLHGGLVFVPEGLLKIARRFNAGYGRIDG